jgi:hypothetical protein
MKKLLAAPITLLTRLQSYNFPDRYIRHSNYVLRIDPVTTATGRAAATFRLVA